MSDPDPDLDPDLTFPELCVSPAPHLCLQEEMVRLQQNMEELKAASGQHDGQEKVGGHLLTCL